MTSTSDLQSDRSKKTGSEPASSVSAGILLGGELADLIRRLEGRRVLVVGDVIADQYILAYPERISREAPVLILRQEDEYVVPGGAGNTAQNLSALGARPVLVSCVGDDSAGRALTDALRLRGVSTESLVRVSGRPTFTKTRILAGDRQAVRQQVVRVDKGVNTPVDESTRARLRDELLEVMPACQAVIFSDYGLGAMTDDLIRVAIDRANELGIPTVADSRYNLLSYVGVTCATPNQVESEQALGKVFATDEEVEAGGFQLRQRLGSRALVMTRGAQGMDLFLDNQRLHIPAVNPVDVFDVTGAGDTVTATLALALAAGADWVLAASLANLAAGLVVRKMGTRTVTRAELLHFLEIWGHRHFSGEETPIIV
ncbi:MAG: bifunctional hydroxymethylpyrimidine kinase/phosphomethylpyrimidine kinase [Limnochordales bacterium]|nr:bifunctional hydroxymethylpyrimidine kinase/phosphomethylpyrimidine kinase [Limnochordales bacterium]